jgi:hypothetical protein
MTGRDGAGEEVAGKSEECASGSDGMKSDDFEKADGRSRLAVFGAAFEAERKAETSNCGVFEATGVAPGTGVEVTVTAGDVGVTGGEVSVTGGDVSVTGGEVPVAAGEVSVTGGDVGVTGGEVSVTGGEV